MIDRIREIIFEAGIEKFYIEEIFDVLLREPAFQIIIAKEEKYKFIKLIGGTNGHAEKGK